MSSLQQWFQSLEQDAEAKLKALGAEAEVIAEKIGTVVVDDFEAGLAKMGSYALDAVVQEAPKLISGQEKASNAVTNVAQKLEADGIGIVMGDVQMAVQGAYRALQVAASKPAS